MFPVNVGLVDWYRKIDNFVDFVPCIELSVADAIRLKKLLNVYSTLYAQFYSILHFTVLLPDLYEKQRRKNNRTRRL